MRIILLFVAVWMLAFPGFLSADQKIWKEHFDKGVKALEAKKSQEAEEHFLKALEEARKDGRYSVPLSSTYMNLGHLYAGRGNYEAAAKMHFNALAINQKVLGPNHPETTVDMANLANAYAHTGKEQEAEALSMNALNILKASGHSNSPAARGILTNLKLLYQKQGKQDLVKQIEELLAAQQR